MLLFGGGGTFDSFDVLDATLLILYDVREEKGMQVALMPFEFARTLPCFAARVDMAVAAGYIAETF